jgi:phage gp46-like protein
MPDFQLVPFASPAAVTFDWLQTPTGAIDETQQLATAILVALNTDATADASEVLPDPRDSNRRGWWGDLNAEAIWNGWPIGSKLWLLTRAKIVDRNAREGATITRVENYILRALQPFIDHGICTKIITVATQKDAQTITALITVYRGPKTAIQLEYQTLWSEIFPGS